MPRTHTTATATLTIEDIPVEVVRKRIKNMHLSVHAPDGRVRLSLPLQVSDEDARQLLTARLGWIRRHRQKYSNQQPAKPLAYLSGEMHPYLGQAYPLQVIERPGRSRVDLLPSGRIELRIPLGSTLAQRQAAIHHWYRATLNDAIPLLIAKWQALMGVTVNEWGIRQMKTRWGSCNIRAKRIWINLELAKHAPSCLEYIVVHEMVHLFERLHNQRFYALMTRYLPDWQSRRKLLNQGSKLAED